jgi:hypothetical protein
VNSLERAKLFLAKKASRLALAVLPLAAIAVPAHAGSFSAGGCGLMTGSGSCTVSQASSTGGNSQANWLQMFGSGWAQSSGGWMAEFFASGGASGSLSGNVPVSWDFSVNNVLDPTVDWSVDFEVFYNMSGSQSIQTAEFSQSGSGSTPFSASGSGLLSLPNGAMLNGYSMDLFTSSSGAFTVDIPENLTMDLNPASGVPEPSTILLVSAGGAALLWRRRKKA